MGGLDRRSTPRGPKSSKNLVKVSKKNYIFHNSSNSFNKRRNSENNHNRYRNNMDSIKDNNNNNHSDNDNDNDKIAKIVVKILR